MHVCSVSVRVLAVHAQSLTLCSERGGNVFLEQPTSPAALSLMAVAHKMEK